MSYKLALILSTPFLMMVLLLLGDIADITLVKSGLDSLATVVGYRIAYGGRLDANTEAMIADYGATIVLLDEETPRIGDTVAFRLYKEYDPFIVSSSPLQITVTRSTVVGYYDH
ncbi:MAG: hypothetical protein IJU64_05795 [Bacilli bacterium]|nr:hypothetical protein [Bacilli bacterium]